eukprot:4646591-Pleurochrysis_carterae.AAC.1
MSEPDIARPQRRSEAAARAALAAARGAVIGLEELEGQGGGGIAALQSAAVDASGLGLEEVKYFLALSLLQQAGGGAGMVEGGDGIRWAGAAGGEVE